MLYSYQTLLWIVINFRPWVDAIVPQSRHYLNSTFTESIGPATTHSLPPLATNTISTSWSSYQRSRTSGWLSPPGWDKTTTTMSTTVSETAAPTNSSSSLQPSKWTANATDLTSSGRFGGDLITSTLYLPSSSTPRYSNNTITATSTSTDCISLAPGEPFTSWSIVPNTTTITVTLTANMSISYTSTPEFTPPAYCSETPAQQTFPFYGTRTKGTSTTLKDSTDSAVASSSTTYGAPVFSFTQTFLRPTVTVITTSKNPVTVTTVASLPDYLNNNGGTAKQTVNPSTYTDTHKWHPFQPPPAQTNPPLDISTIDNNPPAETTPADQPPQQTQTPAHVTTTRNGDHSATTRITQIVDGITVIVSPSQVVIGGQVVSIGGPPRTVVEGGETFTVNPTQVIGPSLVVNVPTFTDNGGGQFQETPKPSTVQGVPVQVGPTQVVVDGSTFANVPGGPPRTVVVKGQTVSIGAGGVGFSGTTITRPPSLPTNVVIIDGEAFSAIGSSVAVIRGTTFNYGPGSIPQTVVLNGEVITIGPAGVFFDGTTIGAVSAPQTIALHGGVITIGPEGIVHDGTSIGFSSTPKTTVLDGQTVTIGPTGITLHGTTIGATQASQTIALNGAAVTVGLAGIIYDGTTIGFSQTPQTLTLGGEVVTIGPSGFEHDGTTILNNAHPTGTQYGLAGGLSISEIGSTLAVIGGQTITLGPGITPFTTIIDGYTITGGPGGITVGGATLTAPFNPITQAITAGGITFSQVGSSLVIIGGKTYTFGPGSPQTTDIYNGQTISIGPGGVGFKSTTYTGTTPSPTAKATGKKKNGVGRLEIGNGVLGACVVMCICYLV